MDTGKKYSGMAGVVISLFGKTQLRMSAVLIQLRRELKAKSDKALQQSSQRFFKETIKTYGIRTNEVVKMAKVCFKTIKDKPKADIFTLCEALWQSGYLEESFIACNWSYALRRQYAPADFAMFRRWVSDYVTNWAACDTLCNHTVGTFLEMYPAYLPELKPWTHSSNRWLRRAAAVSLIVPARKGLFLPEILDIAGMLLTDGDDMVQKGYGWMLKAASQAHEQAVFDYVLQHRSVMPRTALRYAIEKMPPALKAKAMKK